MLEYRSLLQEIYENGAIGSDRTGTGTKSMFGKRMEFNCAEKFPILSTKKINFHAVKVELLWMLKGRTDISYLHRHKVHIWDAWVKSDGTIGKGYGHQWRNSGGLDQIHYVIEELRNNPSSRRLVVSSWNPSDIPFMALPPCHTLFQFYVRDDDFLDLQLYQRSADMFLGVPFNISSYSLLLEIVSAMTGYNAGRFIWVGGDCHIYLNHLEQVEEQLDRLPIPETNPQLSISGVSQYDDIIQTIDNLQPEDIILDGYEHLPAIKAPISV